MHRQVDVAQALSTSGVARTGSPISSRTKPDIIMAATKIGSNPAASKKRSVTNSELKSFLKGASAAQQAQIQMIYRVFDIMDADSDGFLSVSDVKSYFRSVGRVSDDLTVKKWIRARDINQSGTVSLPEFVASYAHQLDPDSRSTSALQKVSGSQAIVSPVITAFGALRLGNSPPEAIKAVEAAEEYLRRALDSPSTEAFWRISKKDASFHQNIGRLFGGVKLMHSLGFVDENNGAVLALRDESGTEWTTLPQEFRRKILRNLEELNLHKQSLLELSVSHIAAGTSIHVLFIVFHNFLSVVSTAIGGHGDSALKITEWGVAMETLHTILSNILKHPGDAKYYRINTSNPNFHRRYFYASVLFFLCVYVLCCVQGWSP